MTVLFNEDEKISLLKLARTAIEGKLIKGKIVSRPQNPAPHLLEKRGCFVTLHTKDGDLRGCIGNIEPSKILISGIEENALNAAFRDPRFSGLTKDELPDIKIEISVLTVPQRLDFINGDDLKQKLKAGIHGVILSHGWNQSTFLPQVWDQLPDKQAFLEHLCIKGGMGRNCWKDNKTIVQTYEAYHFSE